jgi:hypothetical protein
MFRCSARSRALALAFLALLAAEVVGGERLAAAARRGTGYTCVEGVYLFDHAIYDAQGHQTGCALKRTDDAGQDGGPYSTCGPSGTTHPVNATQGWNAFRGICYGAITYDTSPGAPTTDHLTGVL